MSRVLENFIHFIEFASRQCSNEAAQTRSLVRAFSSCKHKRTKADEGLLFVLVAMHARLLGVFHAIHTKASNELFL